MTRKALSRVGRIKGLGAVVREPVCGNCRFPKSKHLVVNYADAPYSSEAVLICPSAVFSVRRAEPAHD